MRASSQRENDDEVIGVERERKATKSGISDNHIYVLQTEKTLR